MKPRPITSRDRNLWTFNGVKAKKAVFKCPDDLKDCQPVETAVSGDGVIHTAWVPSEQELAVLEMGGTVWLSVFGGIFPPVDIQCVFIELPSSENGSD